MSRPKTMDTRITMSVTDTQLSGVDEWRRVQPDIPPRSEAIRRLVDLGLNAKELDEHLSLDTEHIQLIDKWRSQRSDFPSRTEAIRQLVGHGLFFDRLYAELHSLAAEGIITEQVVSQVLDNIGYSEPNFDDTGWPAA